MSQTTCDSEVCTWMQARAAGLAHSLVEDQHSSGEACLHAHGSGEFPREGS